MVLAAGAAGLAVVWIVLRAGEPARVGSPAASGMEREETRDGDLRPEVRGTALPPLPASLAGTSGDGALVLDEQGRFVPTPDAIDLFDYYLAAEGEESEALIRDRILAAIRVQLPASEQRAAEKLLDDYLLYRVRAAELMRDSLGADLERRLQWIRELRREVFGEELARRLFGEEEARWFVDLERRRVISDAALSPEQRDRRLASLEETRPPSEQAARSTARAHRDLREEEARLRAEGASAAEIDRLRESRFGAEAASRLAGLDAERARFQERLDAYRVERDRLVASGPPDERAAQIEELRARHFAPREVARVRALDRLDR